MENSKHRRSVLVVEDDPHYGELLHEAFSEAGFRSLHAIDGQKALRILREQPVDLVVADFIMPELNGLELCRLVGADIRLSKVRCVLYSGNTDPLFRIRARELGALDYLAKTEDTATLVNQIRELAGWATETADELQREQTFMSLATNLKELKPLVHHLLELIEIAAVTEPAPPAARLAWGAAQRTGGEVRRILEEIEKSGIENLTQPGYSSAADRAG